MSAEPMLGQQDEFGYDPDDIVLRQLVDHDVDLQTASANGASPAGSFAARVASRRVDLFARIKEGLPEIAYIGGSTERYVAGRRHYLPGPKKTGKSFLAALDAVDVTLAGGHVVILDRENGANLYAGRLEAIIASRCLDEKQQAEIAARLAYFEFPRLARTDETKLVALCSGADLVVFDSQRMFLSDLGLDENDSDDYAAFMAALVDPLFRAGVATLILDNAGHADPKRGRGSSSKADLNEILFTIDAVEPFDAVTTGRLRLDVAQSRLGTSGRWELDIGGGLFGHWRRIDQAADDEVVGFRPTSLMERASIFVENCTDRPARRTVTDAIGGKTRYARIAIDCLVREGYVRGAKREGLESIKPYREATDSAAQSPKTSEKGAAHGTDSDR